MSNVYTPLSTTALSPNSSYRRPPQVLPGVVKPENPATTVMTDFTKVAAITMGPSSTIDHANTRMISAGVKLLFVVNQESSLLGLVTYRDINGEKPLKYIQEVGGKREDITLRDIMTPQSKIDVLHMVDVENAKVGDIISTLMACGRQHALVVDYNEDRTQIVRGLFSATQIGRQLGSTIQTTEIAHTLADLKSMLA